MFHYGKGPLASFLWSLPEGTDFTIQIYDAQKDVWNFTQHIDYQTKVKAMGDARILADRQTVRVVKLSRYCPPDAIAPTVHLVVAVYPARS